MARISLIRSHQLPYHLYGRANNREWFYIPQHQAWEIFLKHLRIASEKRGLQIHAFVLMANHYHLFATAAGEAIDHVMCRLLKGISDDINLRAGRINHVFGGPYKWTLVEEWFHYHHTLRYVYQNPIRAGVCRNVTDYPLSTLNRFSALPLVSHPFERTALHNIRQRGHSDWLSWLNVPYDLDHVDGMRRALSRRRFAFCKSRTTRKVPMEFRYESCTK